MTKQQIYEQKQKEYRKKAQNKSDEYFEAILLLLNDTRHDIINKIIIATTRSQLPLSILKTDIENSIREFNFMAKREADKNLNSIWNIGIDQVDIPLLSIGFTRMIGKIDRKILEIVKGYSFDLISNLSNDTLAKINQEIFKMDLANQDISSTINAIGVSMEGKNIFSSIARRAEIITKTESGRVAQFAQQERSERVVSLLPDLQKTWQHSDYVEEPRTGHEEAHGYTVPIDDPFLIHWEFGMSDDMKEALLFPRDPAGSAANTINCHCYVIDSHPNWDMAIARQNDMDIVGGGV